MQDFKRSLHLFSGIFKDDLAQVDFVDASQNTVHLKLIPRIDYTRLRGALKYVFDTLNSMRPFQ